MLKIMVRGSGDIGSAVALNLFKSGYGVIIHDEPQPTTTRRKMAFSDAIFDGQASLSGAVANLVASASEVEAILVSHTIIPVSVAGFSELLSALRPDVLVDARMRKHSQPETQISLAPLTIGLGPNFVAGKTVHLIIETSRGPTLGQVIREGSSLPLAGEPAEIAGHARDRYVYAPIAGVFHTTLQVGDVVQQGQVVGQVNGQSLAAPLSGLLRGLTHDGVPVRLHTKIIEVDPRLLEAQISGVSERSASVAQGVLNAINIWKNTHSF